MREIDPFGRQLCSYQAKIFASSIEKTECSSNVFIRRYMNSDYARRMDGESTLFESSDAFTDIEEQYGPSVYGKEKYSMNELYWIGYIYRYWAYTSNQSSKQLYKLIGPKALREVYFPYHSLDPKQAIERLIECLGPDAMIDVTDIARGVAIMRKNRNRSRL